MFKKEIIVSLVSLLLVQQVAGSLFGGSSSKNFIDQNQPLDSEALNKLCSDSSQRISKVSTLSWLLGQLKSPSIDPSLAQCKSQYLEPLEALNQLIIAHKDDVCNLEKVKLIDQFHWNYQMGAMSKKWMKFAKGPLPESLKMFFLHYVSEITKICKAHLTENLGIAVTQKDTSEDEATGLDGNFGRIVHSFQQVIVPFEKIKHYDNFVLLWDMVVSYERKKNNQNLFTTDPSSGESIVALVKVKDATGVWRAQQRCRQILRPVYRNTLLPVMKLIDMGYDRREKQSDERIQYEDELKKWYKLTQTCELLLPIKFYQDKTMYSMELGILDSFDQVTGSCFAEPMTKKKLVELSQVEVPSISLPSDELESAISSDETKLLKSVKSNAKNRGHLYRKIVQLVVGHTFSKTFSNRKEMSSMLKKLKLTANDKPLDEEQLASAAMKETDELFKDEEEVSEKPETERMHQFTVEELKQLRENTEWRPPGKKTLKAVHVVTFIVIVVMSVIAGVLVFQMMTSG